MNKLDKFKGNILTSEEKEYRLMSPNGLYYNVAEIDEEIFPYLVKINGFPFIVTTQSCCGHKGENNRKAHIAFRCALTEKDTIDLLLRPMSNKFEIYVELILEEEGLRYCLRLDNNKWKEQLNYFIDLLLRVLMIRIKSEQSKV